MYNRYVRNDQGTYTRMSPREGDYDAPHRTAAKEDVAPQEVSAQRNSFAEPSRQQHSGERPPELRWMERLMKKIHLDDIDAGDLLLLLLLFILFRENGDEEILFAIGLLLIM